MPSDLDFLRQHVNGVVRGAGQGMGVAIAITDDEVVSGKSGLFGRWGSKVERFPLSHVAEVRTVPNPTANLLTVEFASSPPRSLVVMYERDAEADFTRIVAILQRQLTAGGRA